MILNVEQSCVNCFFFTLLKKNMKLKTFSFQTNKTTPNRFYFLWQLWAIFFLFFFPIVFCSGGRWVRLIFFLWRSKCIEKEPLVHLYKIKGTFMGHTKHVYCIQTAENRIVSGSGDHTIKVYYYYCLYFSASGVFSISSFFVIVFFVQSYFKKINK